MSAVAFAVAVIFGLMLAEARLSRRHERWLLEHGAVAPVEPGYPLMAVVYPACFLSMGAEGWWRGTQITSVFAAGVLMFIAGKGLKYWAIATLGERWTFKVHVLPGQPLIASGPYRFVAHPNYIGLIGELAGTAMMTGARMAGPVSVVAFGWILWRRVRFESRALFDGGEHCAPRRTAVKSERQT